MPSVAVTARLIFAMSARPGRDGGLREGESAYVVGERNAQRNSRYRKMFLVLLPPLYASKYQLMMRGAL
jgi:hypothetical protein